MLTVLRYNPGVDIPERYTQGGMRGVYPGWYERCIPRWCMSGVYPGWCRSGVYPGWWVGRVYLGWGREGVPRVVREGVPRVVRENEARSKAILWENVNNEARSKAILWEN